jgi:outer membrane protein OmpA-like peptidoglycan-associated protein
MRGFFALLSAALLLQTANAQRTITYNTDGRWVIGLRGGANVWFTDLNLKKIGPGGDLSVRYGISRAFSLGLTGGYEVLKTEAEVPEEAQIGPTPYLRDEAFTGSLVAYLHLSPGSSVNPSLYAGAGGMAYKRKSATVNGASVPIIEDTYSTSLHIPVGLTLDFFLGRSVSFTMDLGYRFLDDWTEYRKIASTMNDGYATVKGGVNIFLGRSGSDDDDLDGLTNAEEARHGTDPANPDTDSDVLRDGEEVHTTKTDPKSADSDNDGLKDGEEITRYKSNPLQRDTDGDGLIDGDEGTKHRTDLLKKDTDGEGLTDGAEVSIHRTDPLRADSDGDELSDAAEVNTHTTDPLKADTDDGSVADGVEVGRGTNPLEPSDDVSKKEEIKVEVGRAIVLEGVTFRTGSAEVTPESEQVLQTALNTLLQNRTVEVEIHGHTDNTGSLKTNMRLSERRAESVRNWLVNRGVEPARVGYKGFGPDKPIAPNTTAEGRQTNRRIEFFRTK